MDCFARCSCGEIYEGIPVAPGTSLGSAHGDRPPQPAVADYARGPAIATHPFPIARRQYLSHSQYLVGSHRR